MKSPFPCPPLALFHLSLWDCPNSVQMAQILKETLTWLLTLYLLSANTSFSALFYWSLFCRICRIIFAELFLQNNFCRIIPTVLSWIWCISGFLLSLCWKLLSKSPVTPTLLNLMVSSQCKDFMVVLGRDDHSLFFETLSSLDFQGHLVFSHFSDWTFISLGSPPYQIFKCKSVCGYDIYSLSELIYPVTLYSIYMLQTPKFISPATPLNSKLAYRTRYSISLWWVWYNKEIYFGLCPWLLTQGPKPLVTSWVIIAIGASFIIFDFFPDPWNSSRVIKGGSFVFTATPFQPHLSLC